MKDRKNIVGIMSLLLLTTFLLLSLVSASGPVITLTISNGTISAQGFFIYDAFGKYPAPIITNFNEAINLSVECYNATTSVLNNVTGNYTNSTSQVCNSSGYYTRDIPVTFANQSLVVTDTNSQAQYNQCLQEKAQYSTGLNTCADTLTKQIAYKDNYTQCSTDLQICNADKSRITTDKTTAETNYTNSKNAKYYFGVGGLILGIVGYMFYRKEIGGPKHTQQDSYQAHQAG